MPQKIILLTGEREAPYLLDYVTALAPALETVVHTTKSGFLEEVEQGLEGVRLLSFLSPIIIPARVLNLLDLVPYNIHPGPPDRPGLFPESFASVEGVSRYGVTVHEMIAEIDAGPIVAVEMFDLPPLVDRMTIIEEAERRAVTLFAWLAQHCVVRDTALPHIGVRWSGIRRTRKDYTQLLKNNPDLEVFER